MIEELDQPSKTAGLTYVPPGGADNIVRVFYLAHVSVPREIQEMINIIRSMTEMQLVSAYNPANAIVLRGAHAQIEQAEWIVKGLDIAPDQPLPPVAAAQVEVPPGSLTLTNPAARAYHTRQNQARIFYLKNNQTPAQVQEMVNVIRSVTEIQRITAFNTLRAICLLSNPAQAAATEWLVNELQKPTPQADTEDSYYMTPEFGVDGEVRVFFVPSLQTPQATQQLVNLIRGAKIQRITPYNPSKAIVIRGAAGAGRSGRTGGSAVRKEVKPAELTDALIPSQPTLCRSDGYWHRGAFQCVSCAKKSSGPGPPGSVDWLRYSVNLFQPGLS